MLTQLIALLVSVTLHASQLQMDLDATVDRLSATCEEYRTMADRLDALQMENEDLRAELENALQVEAVECGACGAHVNEWWYLAPYAPDGTVDAYAEPVPVCEYCYIETLD